MFGNIGNFLSRRGGAQAPSGTVELEQQQGGGQQQSEADERPEPREENERANEQQEVVVQRDIESNVPAPNNKETMLGGDEKYTGPMARFEPIRTDPIKALKDRQKRLDNRVTAKGMPEIHFVGQITAGQGLIMDTTEGAFCRYSHGYKTIPSSSLSPFHCLNNVYATFCTSWAPL